MVSKVPLTVFQRKKKRDFFNVKGFRTEMINIPMSFEVFTKTSPSKFELAFAKSYKWSRGKIFAPFKYKQKYV